MPTRAQSYRRAVAACLAKRRVTVQCLVAAHKRAYGTEPKGGLMGLGAARHSRKKINRLMFPERISAPWLTPVGPYKPSRGRRHHFGAMHFSLYRRDEMPIGPGTPYLPKKPYQAKVCIGKTPHSGKRRIAGELRSQFSKQAGDTMGCEWGGGNTPTKALASALQSLGRRLKKVKRGR